MISNERPFVGATESRARRICAKTYNKVRPKGATVREPKGDRETDAKHLTDPVCGKYSQRPSCLVCVLGW